jgi:carnitine 3-dehydrogenase
MARKPKKGYFVKGQFVAEGSEEQLAGRSIADWERYRDDCLMAVQAAIKATKLKHGIAPDA